MTSTAAAAMASATASTAFNATSVDLDSADPAEVVCYLNSGGNDYNGQLGARVSALFVILIVSTATTYFPIVAKRVKRLRIPLHVYLFARYFGAGVIVATAFIHLLDPAYSEIGPNTCVGMTGNWAVYSWPPAIVLVSVMCIFMLDLGSALYVEKKYGVQEEADIEGAIVHSHQQTGNSAANTAAAEAGAGGIKLTSSRDDESGSASDEDEIAQMKLDMQFRKQIAAFYILEFGVILHSVFIGLNLGVAGAEFRTLYPVLVFHQSFEGLGIGARLSAIPIPHRYRWLPWFLCGAYGLTTPIAIAIGLGLRNTYQPGSFTANIVSGVFDSVSAGILIYTGLVELLARDFLFDPARSRDIRRISFMLGCVMLGAGLMALLGKWA